MGIAHRCRARAGAFSADRASSSASPVTSTPTSACPGGADVPAGGVTAVGVVSHHRRQGHLTRLMETAAPEPWPTRASRSASSSRPSGPSTAASATARPSTRAASTSTPRTARFLAEPSGTIEVVMPSELRPELERVHELRRRRTPGAISRPAEVWDAYAGVRSWPGQPARPGPAPRRAVARRRRRRAGRGGLQGRRHWERNRPAGKAEVTLLVGATPEAERELWRHLCEIDWVATVTAGNRGDRRPAPAVAGRRPPLAGSTCSTASGPGCSMSPPPSAPVAPCTPIGWWSRSTTRRASRPGGGASSSAPTVPT